MRKGNLRRMKYPFLCAILLFSAVQAGHAQVIAAWNFQNDTNTTDANGNSSDNSPTPSTLDPYGTASADAIGMGVYATPSLGLNADDITTGVVGDTGTNTIADTTSIWRIRAQGTSSAKANGWSSTAPIGKQGAQFFAPTTGLTSATGTTGIQITFDWYATSAGEANMQFEYTTDGTNFTNAAVTLGSGDTNAQVLTNSSNPNLVTGSYVNATGGQDWFTNLTVTINNPSVLNDPNFGIEMVNAATGTADLTASGAAENNSSGNWRFDNVSIAAVPEPGTWTLFIGSLAALFIFVAAARKGSLRA